MAFINTKGEIALDATEVLAVVRKMVEVIERDMGRAAGKDCFYRPSFVYDKIAGELGKVKFKIVPGTGDDSPKVTFLGGRCTFNIEGVIGS